VCCHHIRSSVAFADRRGVLTQLLAATAHLALPSNISPIKGIRSMAYVPIDPTLARDTNSVLAESMRGHKPQLLSTVAIQSDHSSGSHAVIRMRCPQHRWVWHLAEVRVTASQCKQMSNFMTVIVDPPASDSLQSNDCRSNSCTYNFEVVQASLLLHFQVADVFAAAF